MSPASDLLRFTVIPRPSVVEDAGQDERATLRILLRGSRERLRETTVVLRLTREMLVKCRQPPETISLSVIVQDDRRSD